eukprot:XP_016660026.1 PREDICTED: uncharacterized protein LOC107883798 [Acyrthosiphon pisum]
MWVVVHFLKDDSVEAVPSTWYNNGTCAWPNKTINAVRAIQKRTLPNKLEFQWLNARKLGSMSDSYEEAKRKANIAQVSSDVSEIEQKETRKKRAKVVESSPSPSPKKSKSKLKEISFIKPLEVFKNKKVNPAYDEDSLSINSFDDNDKDPDFILKSPDICEITSPIGKIRVESMSDSKLIQNKKTELSSNSLSMNDVHKYSTSSTSKPQKVNAKKNLFNDSQLFSSPIKLQQNMDISPSYKITNLEFSSDFSLGQGTNNQLKRFENTVKNNNLDGLMSTADFQKHVLSVLTHLRFEVNNMASTQQIMATNIEVLMGNANKTLINSSFNNDINNFDINEIFPIETDVALEEFESKIKTNENDFRRVLIRKLCLLVTTKSLGDSVRRIMSRMFHDNILQQYSTYGFKKKRRFASLESYRIVIDILRTHVKYEMTPEKDIDHEIGTWLAHAHFRIKKKILKDSNKNN